MHIGQIIRKLRKEKKISLSELSQKSGVALATLSRMENGKMTGRLESHIGISKALGLILPELYKDLAPSKKAVEVRKAHKEVFVHNKGASYEPLTSNAPHKMAAYNIRIAKNGITDKATNKPVVEKFVYILQGRIEAVIGDERYNLTKGDRLYFDSPPAHYFKNTGNGEARLICIVCPPTPY